MLIPVATAPTCLKMEADEAVMSSRYFLLSGTFVSEAEVGFYHLCQSKILHGKIILLGFTIDFVLYSILMHLCIWSFFTRSINSCIFLCLFSSEPPGISIRIKRNPASSAVDHCKAAFIDGLRRHSGCSSSLPTS